MDRKISVYVSMTTSQGKKIGDTSAILNIKDKIAILTPTINGITDSGYNLVRGYNLADDLILQRGSLPDVPVVLNIPSNYALVGNDSSLPGLVLDSRLNGIPSLTINNGGIISGVGANSNTISVTNGNYSISSAGRKAGDGIVNTSTLIPKINNTGRISGGGGAAASGVTFSGGVVQQWRLSTIASGGLPYGVGGSFVNSDPNQGVTSKTSPLLTNVTAGITGYEFRDSPFPNEGNVLTTAPAVGNFFLHVKHTGGDQTFDIYASPQSTTMAAGLSPNSAMFRTRNFDSDVIVFAFRSTSYLNTNPLPVKINIAAYILDGNVKNEMVATIPMGTPSDSKFAILMTGNRSGYTYKPATSRANGVYVLDWNGGFNLTNGSSMYLGVELSSGYGGYCQVTFRSASDNRDVSKIINDYNGVTVKFNNNSINWFEKRPMTLIDTGIVGNNDARLAYYLDVVDPQGKLTTFGPYKFNIWPTSPANRIVITPGGDMGKYAFTTKANATDGSWSPGTALVGKATINNAGNGVVITAT